MTKKLFTVYSFALFGLGAAIFSSVAFAQAPILFTDTFDTPPTLASFDTAGAWYPDRYPPTIFEQYNFGGRNVLHVGIRLADAYYNRPSDYHNTFSNTQGRKFDLASGNSFGTALIADLYVGADWNTKHRMATLWSSANDSTGATSFFNYIGFRNSTGSDPGFYVFGYHNIGAYTLLSYPVTYGQWYTLKVELTDTAFVYSINGTVVLSDTALTGTKYFSNLILEAYNFADSTLGSDPSPSFDEYDVYWDNVGAVRPAMAYNNPAPVDLLSAGNFRILAGSAVTIGKGATVPGNVGVSPGNTVTDNGTVTGTTNMADSVAGQAQLDLITAYNDAAGRTADTTIGLELGGTTLGRGVYVSAAGTFAITDTLTLSGTATDIFIFKMATTLTTGSASSVVLTGGALASNVFWQVGSSATINGLFKGNILALTAITQNSGASTSTRALARNSFVTVSGVSGLSRDLQTLITPETFALTQNYPNPFNPSTVFSFSLPAKSLVSLKVYDVLGREVSVVLSQEMPAGNYSKQWNAAALPSGVYFYRLEAGSFAETKKLLLLK
jgi:Ice-binding-like/Secretion system C-terminal sorting domain